MSKRVLSVLSVLVVVLVLLGASACGGGSSSPDAAPGVPDADPSAPDADPSAPDAGAPPEGAYFPPGSPWYEDISGAPLDPASDAIMQWLEDNGGWGTGQLRIDFSIEVLTADASTPRMSFEPTGDFYEPDCDLVDVPVPPGGNLEGEDGYECVSDGDCHLIVVDRDEGRLYEMWRANIVGGTFYGGCLAAWDMTRVYGPEGRGDQCTSADAAGYPIAPLLFTADEVAAGEIAHAIRFILPNERIRDAVFFHPATHGTGATSAPSPAPPYGVHLRLKAGFDESSLPSEGARVVARALKRYGMLLADGGQITLTAQSDRRTTAKWDGLLDTYDLSSIDPTDFEVLELGQEIELTYDCVRTPY